MNNQTQTATYEDTHVLVVLVYEVSYSMTK